ncbi:MAG: DUF2892 domain-containing protein [Flavobacteriales bacterium]|jgi:hypothetical protein|nr:DUF2892 domain-containing protein [Flavobacteriales bacterium]
MKKNMGKTDKIIRLVLALIMAGLYFGNIVSGTFGLILVVLTIIFVATSFISFCPLYSIFGINTCTLKEHK